jgi:hypothetical protein
MGTRPISITSLPLALLLLLPISALSAECPKLYGDLTIIDGPLAASLIDSLGKQRPGIDISHLRIMQKAELNDGVEAMIIVGKFDPPGEIIQYRLLVKNNVPISVPEINPNLPEELEHKLRNLVQAQREKFQVSELRFVEENQIPGQSPELVFEARLLANAADQQELNGHELYRVSLGKENTLENLMVVGSNGVDFRKAAVRAAQQKAKNILEIPAFAEEIKEEIGRKGAGLFSKGEPVFRTLLWHGPMPPGAHTVSRSRFYSVLPDQTRLWITDLKGRALSARKVGERLFHGNQQIVSNQPLDQALVNKARAHGDVEVMQLRNYDAQGRLVGQSPVSVGNQMSIDFEDAPELYNLMPRPGQPFLVEIAHVHPAYEFMHQSPAMIKNGTAQPVEWPLSPSDISGVHELAGLGEYVRIKAVLQNGYSYTYTLHNGRLIQDPLQ